jgi:hypothetical protein
LKPDLHARANLLALAAIAMWGSLATLGVALRHAGYEFQVDALVDHAAVP